MPMQVGATTQATLSPRPASIGPRPRLRVGSLVWQLPSELHENQAAVIAGLGHEHRFVFADQVLPRDLDLLFIQGPYGSILKVGRELRDLPPQERPVMVYWFQQNLDLATPRWLHDPLVPVFSELQRHDGWGGLRTRILSRLLPASLLARGQRLRSFGGILWLHTTGLLDVLGLSSSVYAEVFARRGIPSLLVPRGHHPSYGRLLHTERDIAVTWMGKTRSWRRDLAIRRLARHLAEAGHTVAIHDGVMQPFIYGEERTRLLNRSRFVLNLASHPDDELSIRHFIAAANGAVVVSEPNNNQYPFLPGTHFLSAPLEELPGLIDHYLAHEDQRRAMAERMHALTTGKLTLQASIGTLLDAGLRVLDQRKGLASRQGRTGTTVGA